MVLLTEDKPKIADGAPPLPPFLQPKRRPNGRYIIMPDITHAEKRDRIPCSKNNWYTLIYRWMVRLEIETGRYEFAHTATRRYRNWLETYETKDGIPPHIGFGGAIVAGSGDDTFYPRWVEYAKQLFA